MGKIVEHVLGFVSLYHAGKKCRTCPRVSGPFSRGQSTVGDYIHDPGDTGSQQTFCYSLRIKAQKEWTPFSGTQFSSVRLIFVLLRSGKLTCAASPSLRSFTSVAFETVPVPV